MKRRLFAVFAALVLILALAVPAAAAQMNSPHFLSSSGDGDMTALLVGVGIALVICLALVALQKDVHKKTSASDYVTDDGIHMTHSSDRYTHTTQTRRKLDNNRNKGK